MNTLADFILPGHPLEMGTYWERVHPNYYMLITRLMAQFSVVDIATNNFFGILFGPTAHIAARMHRDLFDAGQRTREMVTSAARTALPPEQFEFFEAINEFSSAACKPRNAMAHGVWMWSSHVGDAGILLLPPKEYMALNARLYASRQGVDLPGTTSTPDPSNIPVYSADELNAIWMRVSQAIDAWLRLTAWVDPENVNVPFANPEGELRAMSTIISIIEGKRGRLPKLKERLEGLVNSWQFKHDADLAAGRGSSTWGWTYGRCADQLRSEISNKT